MQTGDQIKFKNETEEEKDIVYKLIWIDEPRAMIEAQLGWNINPTQIVNADEIELA